MFLSPITYGFRTGAVHDSLRDRYSLTVYRETTRGMHSVDDNNYLLKSTYFWIDPYMINRNLTPVDTTFVEKPPVTTNVLGSVKSVKVVPSQTRTQHQPLAQPVQPLAQPAQAIFADSAAASDAMGSIRIVNGSGSPAVEYRDILDFKADDSGMPTVEYVQLKQSLERLDSLIRDTDNAVDTLAEEERVRAALERFAREPHVAAHEDEWARVLTANYPDAMIRLNVYVDQPIYEESLA